MGSIAVQEYQRRVGAQLTKAEDNMRVLERTAKEVLRATSWAANVEELYFYDRGMTIPEWQDIGCAVQFESYGGITIVSIGGSLQRLYASSTLHYEITDSSGNVAVPRDILRVASNRYFRVSASQVATGRVFAHGLRPGSYTARLLTRTEHANSTDWEATMTIFNASISVRAE